MPGRDSGPTAEEPQSGTAAGNQSAMGTDPDTPGDALVALAPTMSIFNWQGPSGSPAHCTLYTYL